MAVAPEALHHAVVCLEARALTLDAAARMELAGWARQGGGALEVEAVDGCGGGAAIEEAADGGGSSGGGGVVVEGCVKKKHVRTAAQKERRKELRRLQQEAALAKKALVG